MPNDKIIKRLGEVFVRTVALSAVFAFLAATTPYAAEARIQTFDLSIPRQQLDAALSELSRLTGLQIARMSDEGPKVGDVGPLRGEFDVKTALTTLLQDTGLKYEFVSERLVRVVSVQANEPTQPAPASAPAGGMANTTNVANASVAADQGAVALQEVVVTAQKRSERLQDVPVSVTAIDAGELTNRNALQLKDYLNEVPGASVGDLASGRTQVVIRGISTGWGNNPTTGFTIDDVPFGSSSSVGFGDVLVPDLDPADLERVEVLRGPQGTLYGASSMGGLVKFVTADPRMDSVGGQVEVDGSSVEHGDEGYGARGSVSIPVLPGELAIRASGFYRRDPGFIDDPRQGESDVNRGDTYGGHLTSLWHIVPAVDLRVSALLQNRSADGSATEDVLPNAVPVYGDLTHERLPGTDGFDSKVRLYSATLTAGLGAATLTSITGYSQISSLFPQDVSGNFSQFTPKLYNESLSVADANLYQTNKFSQEIRLASSSNHQLEWLVGAFFTHEHTPVSQVVHPVDTQTGAGLAVPDVISLGVDSSYTEAAGFADVTYYFTDRFDVTVGGRYSHNDQDYSEVEGGLLIGRTVVTLANSSGHAATYLFTPRFRISDSLMAYARIASGYRPGGPNPGAVTGIPATYGADRTVNYELGLKGDAFDRRFTFDADVFSINWTNIEIREVDVNNGVSYFGNAGEAVSRGLELSLQALPATGLTLGGNLAYTDAYLTTAGPPGIYAPEGTRLPNSSKWSANVSAQQEVPLVGSISGFGSVRVNYTGDRLAEFQTTAPVPRFVMPSYTTVDLQLGAKAKLWTASIFLHNLTDRRGILDANAENSVTGVGAYYASVIQPRTVGLSFTQKF
jgi:iron complex outermembrane receptor protein